MWSSRTRSSSSPSLRSTTSNTSPESLAERGGCFRVGEAGFETATSCSQSRGAAAAPLPVDQRLPTYRAATNRARPTPIPLAHIRHTHTSRSMKLRRALGSRLAVGAAVAGAFFLLRGGVAHASANSGVQGFGSVTSLGAPGVINQPLISMAATPTGKGYWLVAADGGLFSYNAPFFGSTGNLVLNSPVVDLAPTPSGKGYWMAAADGGGFSFGGAQFYGSMRCARLKLPVVARASSPTGKGYWLVAPHGGVFSFGDAKFFWSTPAR